MPNSAAYQNHSTLSMAMGQPAGIWGRGICVRQSRSQQHCGVVLGWIWHHSLSVAGKGCKGQFDAAHGHWRVQNPACCTNGAHHR